MTSGFTNPGVSTGSDTFRSGGVMRYPHPFFDVAQTYLPVTVKQLFRWCHIYYQQNGLVNNVLNRMSQYPVTRINFATPDATSKQLAETLFRDRLNLKAFTIAHNLDVFVYGNGYVSVYFPINKILRCPRCSNLSAAESTPYKFEDFKFKITKCTKCQGQGTASVVDMPLQSKDRIRLVRWDPSDIDVFYNEVTGESSYVLSIPANTAMMIRRGNPLFLNSMPQVFIDAVQTGSKILLDQNNLHHSKRENVAGKDMGYGQPLVMPALKDLYLQQVLKKAQEAIAHEHVVPLRIIHPASSGDVSPVQAVDMVSWQNTMRMELQRWKQDPNYTPIVPQPVGFQFMGGQGKSLLLTNELKQNAENIVTSMNVPIEFAFGGLSYSGSSVTLRMLENQFARIKDADERMMNFVISTVCRFLGVIPFSAALTPTRAADDIQRKQILSNLATAGKISDETLLSEFDIDPTDEKKRIAREAADKAGAEKTQFINNAKNQGEASLISAEYREKAQSRAMQAQQSPGVDPQAPAQEVADPGGGEQAPAEGHTLSEKQIMALAKKLVAMTEEEMQPALQQLKTMLAPQSWQRLQEVIQQLTSQKAVDEQQPLPEKLPPRRGAGKAVI